MFVYTDLNEVDPNFKPVPEGTYTYQVLSVEAKEFKYKNTTQYHQAGDTGSYAKLVLGITDHPDHSGRRVFETLFSGPRELRILRRLMDATGVQQTPGAPLTEWFVALTEEKPRFTAPLLVSEETNNKTGETSSVNRVDWRGLAPAA